MKITGKVSRIYPISILKTDFFSEKYQNHEAPEKNTILIELEYKGICQFHFPYSEILYFDTKEGRNFSHIFPFINSCIVACLQKLLSETGQHIDLTNDDIGFCSDDIDVENIDNCVKLIQNKLEIVLFNRNMALETTEGHCK